MSEDENPLPKKLYKFRTFGHPDKNGRDKEFVTRMLSGQLQFSSLESFNDPFEGKPHVIPAHDNPAKQRTSVISYLAKIYQEQSQCSMMKARTWVEDRIKGKGLQEIVETMRSVIHSSLSSPKTRVFCLSGERAISAPLAWSHYADNHRGVCIHFDATQAPFKLAWQVTYSTDYPTVPFPRTARENWDNFRRSLLWKSKLWDYEDEYRLIRTGNPEFYERPELERLLIEWDNETGLAPARSVVGITFGLRMSKETRVELGGWIERNAAHLEIWEAGIHQSRYEVTHARLR